MREKIKNTKSAGKNKQKGFVLSLEMLLFASFLVAGTLTGWVHIRDTVNAELIDTANAIESAISFPYFSDPLRGTASVSLETFSVIQEKTETGTGTTGQDAAGTVPAL
jgi:hypothetical protein